MTEDWGRQPRSTGRGGFCFTPGDELCVVLAQKRTLQLADVHGISDRPSRGQLEPVIEFQ